MAHVAHGVVTDEEFDSHDQPNMFLSLLRSSSMEITNDPRIMAKNVLLTRLGAFHVIAITAVLVANKAIGSMLALEAKEIKDPLQYVALVVLAATFMSNLFAVIVIIIQLFHLTRLSTAGPTGFELARSYYLNANVVTMRHLAARTFFFFIPVFISAEAASIWVKLGDKWLRKLPICIILFVSAIALLFINMKHRNIFQEKYAEAKTREQPMLASMRFHAATSQRSIG
eukprot:CAMPEP_0170645784 /NCGR_PEP_ID=MMETSP0224-20130122/43283_1 /TAXON_ID=285029 /ORGANISM="Togula jolla, Strain CCCM 725" /LENGTH=227 /DNA_ID=CAMNT_0010977061 /DNA_START=70 /DNA_END=753 /DNA_ORIENTATION=+